MDKLGHHKRDLMVSDVKKARDAQQDAKEQFKSALDRFTKTRNIQGGELQYSGRWGQVLHSYISPPGTETRTMRVISSVRGSYTRPDENGSEDREGQ